MAKKASDTKKFSIKKMFKGIGNFFRGIIGEIKKIVWPTPKTTAKNTIVVIVACLLIGVFVWAFDYGMAELVEFVLSFAA